MGIVAAHQTKTALVWRAGGMMWLISVTLFFALLDLYFAKLDFSLTLLTGVGLSCVTIILFLWSFRMLVSAKKLRDKTSGFDKIKGSQTKKWFIIILVLEIIALNVASFTLLGLKHFQYIVPIDILIVGLHFIPLARVFKMPIYYFLGGIVSAISVFSMIFIPALSRFGNLIEIAAIPSLCFIFLNWLTIVYILRDGKKYVS